MSVVLHTAARFTIVRQIANHLDSATYYVRAVIRNAYTDEVIDTLDLEDKGGQRFKKDWKVPADPSGEGFYISIVTSVYSDSGYTTKSENYGDEENTYLVEDRPLGGRGAGAGVSGGIDARTLRRILEETFEKNKPEEVKPPEMPKMRFDEVLTAIKEMGVELKPEKPEPVDFSGVIEGLRSLARMINEKEVTPPADLAPVITAIEQLDKAQDLRHRQVITVLNNLQDGLAEGVREDLERIVKSTTFKIGPTTATMEAPKKEQTEETQAFDLNSLAA